MATTHTIHQKSYAQQARAMRKEMNSLTRSAMLLLLFFGMLTAVFSGIELISTNGLGLPTSILSDSWFSSFLIPGLLLAIVVGGTQAVAFFTELYLTSWRRLAGAIAGFGLMVWIFSESFITHASSWLQVFYFAIGILELWCTLVLLGMFRTTDNVQE